MEDEVPPVTESSEEKNVDILNQKDKCGFPDKNAKECSTELMEDIEKEVEEDQLLNKGECPMDLEVDEELLVDQPEKIRKPTNFSLLHLSKALESMNLVTETCRSSPDFDLFRRNLRKVGYTPDLTFYKLGLGLEHSVEVKPPTACAISEHKESEHYKYMMPELTDMFAQILKDSELTLNNKIPTLTIRRDIDYLQRQTGLFNEHARTHYLRKEEKYLSNVWNLCSALWGSGDNSSESKRKSLSDWLEKITVDMTPKCQIKKYVNISRIEVFKTIFELLSFHKVTQACIFAMEHKQNDLATLLTEINANDRLKDFFQKYVDSWKENEVILNEAKKVYLLLAGVATHKETNICDGLDWVRNFGLHLWYIAPAAASIDVVFNLYKKGFEELKYATTPIPSYCGSDSETSQYDLLYHIMGVYVDNNYQLCDVLDPKTHTGNVMDYRFSWFILQLFLSLQAGQIHDSEKDFLHTSFATQLENMGDWKWAIVVLLYVENDVLKKNLIMKILDRNVSTSDSTVEIETQLVTVFKIPPSWIYKIKALKAEGKGNC